MRSDRMLVLGLLAIVPVLSGWTGPDPAQAPTPVAPKPWKARPDAQWKVFDSLVDDRKLEEASSFAEKALAAARASGNVEEQVRGLIHWTRLRMALHGYETAVRFLKEQPWPETDVLARSVLNLYYGHALTEYARRYAYEIRRREKVDSKAAVDLKAWTREQIYAEALRAFQEVWAVREILGTLPAGALEEYLEPNSYPAGVRPTLRDAVTYLLAGLLENSAGWKPEDAAEVYLLDLDKLLALDGKAPVSPADGAVHPIVRLCAVLADLETWHTAKGELDAALEARIERVTRLSAHFAQDRERLRKDLQSRLEAFRAVSWWSMGMYRLAWLTRLDDAPDALSRARQLAEQGHKAYPDSPGGQTCLRLQRELEQPDYSIQAMSSDAAGKHSIAVDAKNLRRVWFRAWPFDIRRFIETNPDGRTEPSWEDVQVLTRTRPSFEWSADLPETPDFRMHRTFVTPPMKTPGTWAVIASAREDFSTRDNERTGLVMSIGDLVLLTRESEGAIEASVLSGETGRPVAGAEVLLYKYDWTTRHKVWRSVRTGPDGLARFTPGDEDASYFVMATKGWDLAIERGGVGVHRQEAPRADTRSLIYTDRSIYRPGQKILFKTLVYRGIEDEGPFAIVPDTAITVSLLDANGQKVESRELRTNPHGTASGEFVIPSGRMLGHWSLRSSRQGYADLRVEEYKRPTFEPKLADPAEALRLNRPATLKGEVRYYFGLPVTNGVAKWRVQRSPVFPWWWSLWGRTGGETRTVATGTSSLKEDGTFVVTFTPKADERLAQDGGVSYRYLVTADVTDEGGETRTAQRSFRVGFVAVEASLDLDAGFLVEGKPGAIEVKRTDLNGVPAPGKGTWKLFPIQGPGEARVPADLPVVERPGEDRFRTAGDRERTRWSPEYSQEAVLASWKDGAEAGSGPVVHDARGAGTVELPRLKPGAWRLRYETEDAFGAKFPTFKDFVVAGKRAGVPLPLVFKVENDTVQVGQTARILAASGLADQPLTLEVFRGDRRISRRILESGKNADVVEIPVTEADRGGFSVAVTFLRDHQVVQLAQPVFVPWDDKELDVTFSTFRDLLRPGQSEKWSVKVTGPAGKDSAVAAAELLAYMYDRSLDVFAPHHPADPLQVYPRRGITHVWNTSLETAPDFWVESSGFDRPPNAPHFSTDRLKFLSAYGIGGPGYRNGHGGGGSGGGGYHGNKAKAPRPAMAKRMIQFDEATVEGAIQKPRVAEMEAMGYEGKDSDKKALKSEAGPRLTREAAPAVQVRSNFAETAFWQPHLLTGADGSATIEFSVPDSVTSWNVFVHAVTRDLKSGSVKKEARTVKNLMVRPYLPRFLREGDEALLKVVVNNASDKELKGTLKFDVQDPGTGESVASSFGLKASDLQRPFAVAAGGGTNVEFVVKAPPRVGTVAFKVVAVSGEWSDGELRPIPVLPGRMHLAQSRFVVLKDASKKTMRFEDLAKGDDATLLNEQMVVTLDAQLFYSVLSAVPYLVNYPYECTEQTLNRFLSTGILSSMYKDYPAVGAMAKEFSKRKTRFESWDAADPNRKMALEETPWVRESKGGEDEPDDLVNVLDPAIAKAQRESSLAKLRKSQTSSGGFPWFPGGPPSPYMTAYLLYGFAKGVEFGVDVPKDVVSRAWAYLHRHYVDEMVKESIGHDCCWEFVTFVNFVLSSYPDATWTGGVFTDAERKTMLDFSFKHWKDHAPYVKGQLALTLKRMGREEDGRKVWASVMDSAKTTEDQGTFWAPEDRGWLWYNDTVETHAFALRTLMELKPDDGKLDGLVLWLLLNKKLGHWKSTRATSEVVYSLASYLKKTGQLGVREEATVDVGGQKTTFEFQPDKYTGKKNQIVIPGEKVDAQKTSTVVVEKGTPGYLFASATWHFSTERMPAEDRGDYLKVSRQFFKRENTGREFVLTPLKEGAVLAPGDEVEVQISLRSKAPMDYVHLRDPRGAGFEPGSANSRHRWDMGIYWYEEIRDSGTNFFFERLPQGEYTFKYRIRAATAGKFKVGPATVQPMYAPEFTAYSAGAVLGIGGK